MIVYPNVKINLGLSILRKRADGFHDLETLFVPYFGFRDRLEINEISGKESAIRLIGGDWDATEDLTIRAWRLLKADFDIPPVEIILDKHSPVGAGLGGGSADAAFALCAMNDLFGLGLDLAGLAAYAARLGSDCAFFIYNTPMLGTGRGEILTPYEIDLSEYQLRVELPMGVQVKTSEAYSHIVPRVLRPRLPSLREALSSPVAKWKELLINDFEPSVCALYPQIAELKEHFYQEGAIYASMSGSGSAVFGLFKK